MFFSFHKIWKDFLGILQLINGEILKNVKNYLYLVIKWDLSAFFRNSFELKQKSHVCHSTFKEIGIKEDQISGENSKHF